MVAAGNCQKLPIIRLEELRRANRLRTRWVQTAECKNVNEPCPPAEEAKHTETERKAIADAQKCVGCEGCPRTCPEY